MDPLPFVQLRPRSFDLLFIFDYCYLDLDGLESLLVPYQERFLAAWSMGVWVAARFLDGTDLSFRKLTAIGGTLHPIDDRLGIPAARYHAVAAMLDTTTVYRFYADMFSDRQQLQRFLASRPTPSRKRLDQELMALRSWYALYGPGHDIYTDKIILLRDRVIPGRNQQRSWGRGCRQLRFGHFPFYDLGGFDLFLQ